MVFYDSIDNTDIIEKINTDDFLTTLINNNILKKSTGKYYEDCKDMCLFASSWLAGIFISTKYANDIYIYEGYFRNCHHSWIEYKDYFIDITLAQFIKDAPKIAILKKQDVLNEKDYQMNEHCDFFRTSKTHMYKYVYQEYCADFIYDLPNVKNFINNYKP